MKYEPSIGIETHVQLKTLSKLFCSCDNDSRTAKPNTNICPICLGLPGVLPVLNQQAVILAIKAGIALGGKIAKFTKFDRKNYFYPDLPKGYQISQYDQPIVTGGEVKVNTEGEDFTVRLVRSHLEEDAGKLIHPDNVDYSLLDLNRAGTPLLEIVSEPDLHSAKQAKAFIKELHTLVRTAEISDGDLYQGHMRFDINVSLKPISSKQLGTRTEIKNLNSFKSVEKAIAVEIERQTIVLDAGKKVIQETRGWDETKNQTFSMRGKEEAHDYRYFPEPDLPPLAIAKELIDQVITTMPALPSLLREQMVAHKIAEKIIAIIIKNPHLKTLYFEAIDIGGVQPEKIASLLVDCASNAKNISLQDLLTVTKKLEQSELSYTVAKQILNQVNQKQNAQQIIDQSNLQQISDSSQLETIVDKVLKENPKSVNDYRAGKKQALGFLVGQAMKLSQGQANPRLLNEIIIKKIS